MTGPKIPIPGGMLPSDRLREMTYACEDSQNAILTAIDLMEALRPQADEFGPSRASEFKTATDQHNERISKLRQVAEQLGQIDSGMLRGKSSVPCDDSDK